jgi:hypothetical protein
MKTIDATRLYNTAERAINRKYPDIGYIQRGIKIAEFLTKIYGEDLADEILELVFEHEIGNE